MTTQLSLGMVGMHGTVSADWAVERSDLLICIGARFSDRVATNTGAFRPRCAQVVHVDIDAAEINKNIETDLFGRFRRKDLPSEDPAVH